MSGFTAKDLIGTLVVLVILTGGVYIVRQKSPTFLSFATSDSPTISTAPKVPVTSLQSVHSPDGTLKLVLKTQTLPNGQTIYTVTASDVNGGSRRMVYETTMPEGSQILLPPNSWSPDNKFLFLKVHFPQGLSAFVFQADTSAFSDGSKYIDVLTLFHTQFPDAILRDVTGWDDPSLLHVMTYTADKTIGTSYWFDIWSRGFIPLVQR